MGACSAKIKEKVTEPEPDIDMSRSKTGVTEDEPTSRRSSYSAFTGSGSSVASDLVHVLSSVDNRGRIRDYYSVENTSLGVGSFSMVFKARSRRTKQQVAIKSISKAKAKILKAEKFRAVKSEIAVLKMLDHRNIVKLVETFEDERTIRLVMELCDGGELSERLIDAGKFTEAQAATLMRQIFQAVRYMHSKQVCHRDIKPDNVLFDSRESIECSNLKIIDFGSARVFQTVSRCTQRLALRITCLHKSCLAATTTRAICGVVEWSCTFCSAAILPSVVKRRRMSS